MLLSSNYTFEAFFWIILIAIALVTLTIFFATPKPVSKKPQDWNVSHLKGTIDGVSSAKPIGMQKEIQEASSDNIEKETAPEIIKIKKPINYRKMAFAIFGVIVIIGSVSLLQSTFNLFNVEEEECELVPYGKCSEVKLSGRNLSGLDLTGIDLSYADLTRASLGGANLTNANLRGADLTGANLTGADLQYANLNSAYLKDANLTNADLTGAKLYYANLRDADLNGADLTYADLTRADLRYADLTYADLNGADLTDAFLRYADFTDAFLRYADFTDAIVTDADFTNTYWYQTIWTDGIVYDENQA